MKKILKGLLVTILLLPLLVKADMGAPETVPYTATVVKEGGIDCYNFDGTKYSKNGHLDKEEKIKVLYETHAGDITYLAVNGLYGKCSYVKANDVIPDEDEISPKNEGVTELKETQTFIVNADEVKLRKGPSDSYEVIGALKKGTKGTYKYIVSSHAYVEANGISGWVDMIGKRVLTKTKYITAADVQTKCGTIPAGTILEDAWAATNWDGETLIRYKGCEDFIPTFKSTSIFSFNNYKSSKAKGEIKLYKDPAKTQEIGKIPAGAEFNIIAFTNATVPESDVSGIPEYADYNGVQGWLGNSNYDFIKWNEGQPKHPQTITQPDEPKPDETIPDVIDDDFGSIDDDAVETIGEVKDVEKSAKAILGISALIIVALCCGLALVVAVAVVAIIVLVNKNNKDKKKENTVVPEAKVEETVVTNKPNGKPKKDN